MSAGTPVPPSTGHEAVDRAVAELADLADVPLGEHHDRLADAHEALHEALSSDLPAEPQG